MKNEADIVKELRERENLGELRVKSNKITYDSDDYHKIENKKINKKTISDRANNKTIVCSKVEYNNDLKSIIDSSKMLLDLFPEGIAILDKKGIFLDANNIICEWLGYNHESILDKRFFEFPLLLGRNNIPITTLLKKDITNDGMISQEITYLKNNDEKKFGILHINPIRDNKSNLSGYIIMISDITKVVAAEVEINKLKQFHENVIDNANVWLSVMDLESNIILWNKAAETITGYSSKEVLGDNQIWDLLKPDGNKYNIQRNTSSSFSSDQKVLTDNFEILIKRKDGELRTISWNSRVLFDDLKNPIGNIALGQDITDQKLSEEKIREQNAKLEILNKKLDKKVKERTKEIKKLLHQKDEFINQLGHDLKTPLTPLIALVPIIKEKTDNPKDKELLEVLMRNVYYMRDLVTKTIDLAKLNSDKIEFAIEDTNLLFEVENAIKNNKILFEENKVNIVNNINENIIVKADKLRLYELLNNLITNSVKYMPEGGGDILIDAKRDGEYIKVSVKDTGIGMTKTQISHIFNEFYKADDSRHDLDSSGLGLPICKRIVKKHGGKIWAESDGKGKGSTFFFTLKNLN